MDKVKRLKNLFRGDPVIWIVFFLLCIISITEVYSSSAILGYKSGNYWYAAFQHALFLGVGVVAMIITLNVPCRYFKAAALCSTPVSLFLLILVTLLGARTNDAARWLSFGFFTIQPSEFAKSALVFTSALVLSGFQTPNGARPEALKYIGVSAIPLIGLVFPENFSTACLMSSVVILMLFIGRVPLKQMGYLFSALAMIATFVVLLVFFVGKSKSEIVAEDSYKPLTETVQQHDTADGSTMVETSSADGDSGEVRGKSRNSVLHRFDLWKQRIEDFLNDDYVAPEDYDLDKNGQVGYSKIAIASSNVIGVGPGNSVQRDFLPLAFSDFIFAIIIEELGWAGAAFVVLLYVVLLFRTGYIARQCKNFFPAYLAMGFALLIVVQAMFNMMVAVGLAPVTGQPLPLISKGGTSSVMNCVYIGIILSISRTAKKKPEYEKKQRTNKTH